MDLKRVCNCHSLPCKGIIAKYLNLVYRILHPKCQMVGRVKQFNLPVTVFVLSKLVFGVSFHHITMSCFLHFKLLRVVGGSETKRVSVVNSGGTTKRHILDWTWNIHIFSRRVFFCFFHPLFDSARWSCLTPGILKHECSGREHNKMYLPGILHPFSHLKRNKTHKFLQVCFPSWDHVPII